MSNNEYQSNDLVFTNPGEIRARRVNRRMTQKVLAAKSGVSLRTILLMEGGQINNRRIGTKYCNVEVVAETLDCSPSHIIDSDAPRDVRHTPIGRNSNIDELYSKYSSAMTESSSVKTDSMLKYIVAQCHSLPDNVKSSSGARLMSKALTRLGDMESNYNDRMKYRTQAFEVIKTAYRNNPSTINLINAANRLVDYFYDNFRSESSRNIYSMMKEVSDFLVIESRKYEIRRRENKDAENSIGSANLEALIYTQASSIRRCQSQIDSSHTVRMNRIKTMVRCADKALHIAPANPIALLECGQARLHAGVEQRDDQAMILAVDHYIKAAAEKGLPIAWLVLARSYRLIHRPSDAVDAFEKYDIRTEERRMVLAEAHVLGEAAWQMWYQKHARAPEAVKYARGVLVDAIESGYSDARKIASLAFMVAIESGVNSGVSVLCRLEPSSRNKWNDMLESAMFYINNNHFDGLRKAFVFGLDHGPIWNSLGTFAAEFIHDDVMASKLYDVGLKLSPRNCVLWLNRARVARKTGDAIHSEYCCRNARQFSNALFMKYIDEFEFSK